MTINSETRESLLNLGNLEAVIVTLDIQSFTSPEAYDPTSTSEGNKHLDELLGAAVIGVENDVDVNYDHLTQDIRATSQDGTAAPSDLGEVRLLLFGRVGA